jgi:small subunit ribosomal protein S17
MAAKTELTGTVVSDKMAKSRVVAIERQVRHGVYGKTRRLTSTFMAHDEANETKAGDQVVIAESRPLSRRKRWVIIRVVHRADAAVAPAGKSQR